MYEELVKRLRTATTLPVMNTLCQEAADAIEELSQIAAHHEQKAKDYWQEACEYREQIAHLVKEQAALFEPALKSLELSKRPYVLEAPQPRWIPVTERLPKELERVLVACEDGVSFGFFEEIIADDEFVKEWHDMMYYPISVTHWMPLPKSPKEG